MTDETLPPPPPPAPHAAASPEGPRGQVAIEDEMRRSYLDYSMSVIVGRALPEVRDGLKPVHRRILYAMHTEGLHATHRYSKCAGVVGEVLKKYHPHGDASVYDALVRLAQPWNLRYLLIDGQGNFGSVDGDPAAAYRYTECRLEKLADWLLADIDKDTVEWGPNFDDSTEEPLVLPARFPNLLVNGSSGIAVGMATSIPPHNLGEVVDAALHLIANPGATVAELMRFVQGPDFPTSGIILGREGIRKAYAEGRGTVVLRARTEIETHERTGRETIIVTEIPYQVNKSKLVEHIADLVREKRLEGISDLRDESSREGMRIVIELKRDAIAQVVLNNLFAHTALQTGFGVTLLAIDGGQPRILTLKQMLERFVAHRRDVVTRRTRFELRQARAREHILLGLQIALDHLDAIITLVREAPDRETARDQLMARFGLSELQAKAILEMQLQRLTGLERQKILDELAEVQRLIARLTEILGSDAELMKVIAGELAEVRQLFADPRRSEIQAAAGDFDTEDLIAEEEMVVTISHRGYVKRNAVDLYRAQRRGGKGIMGAGKRDEDFLEALFVASTHSYLLVFSDQGRVYWLKVHEIPEASRSALGKPIVNLVQLAQGEKVAAILPVRTLPEPPASRDEALDAEAVVASAEAEKESVATLGQYVFAATRRGEVKRTRLDAFSRPRDKGIIALGIEEGDALIAARLTDGASHILLSTARGMAIRFEETEVRATGRGAYGMRGLTLGEGDEVVAAEAVPSPREGEPEPTILTVTAHGFGKRTELAQYRVQGRGGRGVINIKTAGRNGPVVAALPVSDSDEAMVITNRGMLIRVAVKGIRLSGRNAMGVTIISVGEAEEVAGVARVAETSAEDEEAEGAGLPEGEVSQFPGPAEEGGPAEAPDDEPPGEEAGGDGEGGEPPGEGGDDQ